jgi:stage IV sporulation protein FB
MTGTLQLFHIRETPVRAHFTFPLALVLAAWWLFENGRSWLEMATTLAGLVLSVLLHEVAHRVVARVFGIPVGEVILYLLGGVTRLARVAAPAHEFWIALAGPVASVVLALLLWLLPQTVARDLAVGNFALGLVNFLPAMPLDGGRMLRAFLTARYDTLTSGRIAGRVARLVSVGVGLLMVWYGAWWALPLALFLFLSARQEDVAVQSQSLMRGARVKDAMLRKMILLPHAASIREAAEELLDTSQQEFPVVHGTQVVGLLSRDALVEGLASSGPDEYVASVMDREFLRLSPEASLEDSLGLLSDNEFTALVMDEDKLLGMVTRENLNEYLVLRNFGLRRAMV